MRKVWLVEDVYDEAKKYDSRFKFQKQSRSAYDWATRRGMLDSVCSHMKVLLTVWTYELIEAEALTHNTRNSFKRGSNKAYQAACERDT